MTQNKFFSRRALFITSSHYNALFEILFTKLYFPLCAITSWIQQDGIWFCMEEMILLAIYIIGINGPLHFNVQI